MKNCLKKVFHHLKKKDKFILSFLHYVKLRKLANKKRRVTQLPDAISVKIGRFGGEAREFILEEGSTVNDVLAQAGETLKKGETLTIFGDTVRGTHEVDEGDVVVIQPSTAGA